MKLSATFFAFFAFPTFVTYIPLLNGINDVDVNVGVAAKRLNEQNIDKRDLSPDMVGIVSAIYVYADEYDHSRGYSRSDFTQNIVQALLNRNPHFNYVICHPDHNYDFGSSWGVDVYNVWVTYHHHTLFTKNPGFDIVIGKNGTFTNYGDGGFENWAYNGNIIDNNAKGDGYVTFGIPN